MQEAECAYVIALMAVYWCTEVLPLAITALLPALLFPLFGIMQSKDVSITTTALCRILLSEVWISAHTHLALCDPAVSGVHAVPDGHKPVVCGGTDVCSSCGALESAQAHRFEGAALCWCASSTVSGSDSHLHSRFSVFLVIFKIYISEVYLINYKHLMHTEQKYKRSTFVFAPIFHKLT